MVKPAFGTKMDVATQQASLKFFEDNMKILHPFMPFITEEIWQTMEERTPEQALIIAQYPELKSFDEKITTHFEVAKEIISGIRTIRKDKNISFKEEIALSVLNHEQLATDFDS
jgi:valyl-tRNA synthetase